MIIQFPSIGKKNLPRIAISIEGDALGREKNEGE
jgi:hypothetical protein